MTDAKDYADSGLSIQYALIDHAKRFPDKLTRPDHIRWNGLAVATFDKMQVPPTGRIRVEFLSEPEPDQAVEIKVQNWLELADRSHVNALRTWHDPRFESVVEYPCLSRDGVISVLNVFRIRFPGGHVGEEKWTGNAGFWIERLRDHERIYHASPGTLDRPDFDSLVFKVIVS